ncbi:MAG: hypothetical protein HYZ15_08605 [Sphingobacteriales bacterium]|nr:hypothetical protein [Sphingobacteriales bacterium]
MKKANKKLVPLLFLLLPVGWACSQTKQVFRKSYGYYSERLPGNIPVDPNGNPLPGFGPDTLYTLYMETAAGELNWDSAWVGEKTFTIIAQLLQDPVAKAGIEKSGNQPVIIRAGKGAVLWRLDLVPVEPVPGKAVIPGGKLMIKGRKGKKKFEVHISSLVELTIPPSV